MTDTTMCTRQRASQKTPARLIAVGLTALAISACAVNPEPRRDHESEILTIIGAIERGWETADGAPFKQHFLDFDGARYIESGGQNAGLADLVENHVEPEGDALDSLELNFSNIEIHREGDFAWAVADVEVIAVVKSDKRRIHNRGYETFLLRNVGDAWKVVHTHSSSRPVKQVDEGHSH